MQRRSFLGLCLCSSLIGAFGSVRPALAEPKKKKDGGGGKKDDPNGWVWSYAAKSGKDEQSGTFHIRNHEVFKDEKKVGQVVPEGGAGLGDKVELILTDFGKLNGKGVLEKTKMHPPVWVGTLKTKDGDEWEFKAKLLEK